jgi:hypothetical protein
MSFFTQNMQQAHDPSIDMRYCAYIGEEFCKTYYSDMMSSGFNSVLPLYSQDAVISLNDTNFIGAYDVLTTLAQNGIMKFNYNNLTRTIHRTSNNDIIIVVTGLTSATTFLNFATSWLHFSETFVLDFDQTKNHFHVKNHIWRIFV